MHRSRKIVPAPVSTLIALSGLVIVVTALGQLGGLVTQRVVTVGLVYIVAVVALYMFTGNSGIFSFGHVGLMALGGYLGALLTMTPSTKQLLFPALPSFASTVQLSPLDATLVSGAATAVVAAIIGFPLMRLAGIAASIGTFALLVIANVVAGNWTGVTGGVAGITAAETTSTGAALAWALVAMVVAMTFQRSRIGMRLRASREDEVAARASGISVYLERRISFVLSAFFAGVAGALYAGFVGTFNPNSFYLQLSFLLVAMLVVGGTYSLSGAVVGTISIAVLAELLRNLETGINLSATLYIPGRPGLQQLILSAIMLAVLLRRPRGLMGGKEVELRLPQKRRRWPRLPAPEDDHLHLATGVPDTQKTRSTTQQPTGKDVRHV